MEGLASGKGDRYATSNNESGEGTVWAREGWIRRRKFRTHSSEVPPVRDDELMGTTAQ